MVSCAGFTNDVECVLTLNNEYHIKLIVLTLLLLFSIAGLYLVRYINKEESYMHFWGFWLTKILSILYLSFSVMFYMFLLNPNINMEIFSLIIIAFYLLATALFIGMSVYAGSSTIFRILGFDDWNEFKDNYRERKSIKKYG